MKNVENKEAGEHVFNHDVMNNVTDVNSGHNPASAPVYEFGGKNPREFDKGAPTQNQ